MLLARVISMKVVPNRSTASNARSAWSARVSARLCNSWREAINACWRDCQISMLVVIATSKPSTTWLSRSFDTVKCRGFAVGRSALLVLTSIFYLRWQKMENTVKR